MSKFCQNLELFISCRLDFNFFYRESNENPTRQSSQASTMPATNPIESSQVYNTTNTTNKVRTQRFHRVYSFQGTLGYIGAITNGLYHQQTNTGQHPKSNYRAAPFVDTESELAEQQSVIIDRCSTSPAKNPAAQVPIRPHLPRNGTENQSNPSVAVSESATFINRGMAHQSPSNTGASVHTGEPRTGGKVEILCTITTDDGSNTATTMGRKFFQKSLKEIVHQLQIGSEIKQLTFMLLLPGKREFSQAILVSGEAEFERIKQRYSREITRVVRQHSASGETLAIEVRILCQSKADQAIVASSATIWEF